MKWDWFDQFAMTLMVALILVIVGGVAALVGGILWMLFDVAGITPFLGITVLLIVSYLISKRMNL